MRAALAALVEMPLARHCFRALSARTSIPKRSPPPVAVDTARAAPMVVRAARQLPPLSPRTTERIATSARRAPRPAEREEPSTRAVLRRDRAEMPRALQAITLLGITRYSAAA